MYPRDKEKMTFTNDDANYFYEVMPFGLKNIGATYQRFMDKVFKGFIDRNVEIYVDDMVVKLELCEKHTKNVGEVFAGLRKHNMRLNPSKCVLRIKGGKFLNFMHTHRGIKTNPDKY